MVRGGSRVFSALEGVPSRVFIVLSGADGSGKTTAARLLASLLSLRGPTCTHWLRGSHLLASLLARLLSRFGAFRGGCNPYYGICVPRRLRSVWVLVESWSFVPHLLMRFLLRRLCSFIVCDRGSLDFLVWLVSTLGSTSLLRGVYGGFCSGWLGRRARCTSMRIYARSLGGLMSPAAFSYGSSLSTKCWLDMWLGVASIRALTARLML
jgi:energy-coupling factor transporter ATP-binding protein EcfA2